MKRLMFTLLVINGLILTSCVQPPRHNVSTNSTEKVIRRYKVLGVIDSLSDLFPKKYTNDIQAERFCQAIFREVDTRLKADNNYLSEIPVQFRQMLPKDDCYILKFECGKYTTNDGGLFSKNRGDSYRIDYAIFVEASEKEAVELEEDKIYYLTGTYLGTVNDNLVLPSGRTFYYDTKCRKYSDYEEGSICLGGFLFKNITVSTTLRQPDTYSL